MQTLVIYDETGYVLSQRRGEPTPREPIGVPFLWVEIPQGKKIKITDGIGVDITVIPNEVILEDIPPTEIDLLRSDINDAVMELSMLIAMGGNA